MGFRYSFCRVRNAQTKTPVGPGRGRSSPGVVGKLLRSFYGQCCSGTILRHFGAGARWPKTGVRNVARFGAVGVLGVGITAPILLPTISALSQGVGYESVDKLIVFGKSIAGIRTLPFTTTITYEPPLYTGLVALALFAAFFFTRDLTLRFKIVWLITTAVLLLSLTNMKAQIVWNLFQTPHGTPYRWVFVITAWVVVTATLAWESKTGNNRFGNGKQLDDPNWGQVVIVVLLGPAIALLLLKRWNLVGFTTAVARPWPPACFCSVPCSPSL